MRAPRAASRSEQRNAEARARLEPLAPGERPVAVTVSALVAFALAAANLGAWAAGAKIGGTRPPLGQIVVFSVLMGTLAVAQWLVRYWAVLIMQALLGIAILVFGVLLTIAGNLQAALECVAVISGAGVLFWFLVRAMGRIQATGRTAADEVRPANGARPRR